MRLLFGLVSAQRELTLPGLKQEKNYYLAGENCSLDNKNLNWDSKLELDSGIKDCKLPNLAILPEFLLSFYIAWKDHKPDKELVILSKDRYRRFSAVVEDNPAIWNEVILIMRNELQRIITMRNPKSIELEPPFILGLKALIKVLSK